MSAPKPKYTLILHEVRKKAGLSFSEYLVAEAISHLSNKPNYPWCCTSRENMADFFDLSKRGIQKIIARLEEQGYLEKNSQYHLRTTAKWACLAQIDGGDEQSSPIQNEGGEQSSRGGEQSSPYHNNNNNNLNNNIITAGESYNNTKSSYIEETTKTDAQHSDLSVTASAGSVEEAEKRVVNKFNEIYGTTYKKIASNYRQNFEYWLTEYTVDEIEQAITNSQFDDFWSKRFKKGGIALQLLFRKEKAKSGEGVVDRVDRIGSFLYMKQPTKIRPLTDIEFYKLAKELNVPPSHLKQRYEFLMSKVASGTYENSDEDTTVEKGLRRWIQSDLDKGYTSTCNEIDALDIEDLHPRRMVEIKLFRKQSEYQNIVDDFTRLKNQLADTPAEEQEPIKAQLRELAPKGKQVFAEIESLKQELKKMRELYGVS